MSVPTRAEHNERWGLVWFWSFNLCMGGEAQSPLHLLYLSTAPQLLCFFLLVVKSMQVLDCLVPFFFYFPPPLGQKKCIVLVCQSSFGLIVFTGRIQHPCSWYARTACTIHPQSPSFPDEAKIPSCI